MNLVLLPCCIFIPFSSLAAMFEVLESTVRLFSFFFHSLSRRRLRRRLLSAPHSFLCSLFSPLQFTLLHSFSSSQNHVSVISRLLIIDSGGWCGEGSTRIYGARRAPRTRWLSRGGSLMKTILQPARFFHLLLCVRPRRARGSSQNVKLVPKEPEVMRKES